MRINRVRINNFRGLRDLTVEISSVTSLIGANGTGKSTVILALDWFFNSTTSRGLVDGDCTYGRVGEDVFVEVEFSDLTAADRDALGKYATPQSNLFVARKIRTPDGEERLTANSMGYGPFTAVRSAGNATAVKSAYKALREEYNDLGLPPANSQQAAEDALLAWELNHPDELVEVPSDLSTNFFGFNSQGKMSGLFDYVLISADLRAGEEVSDTRTSVFGRILARSIDRSAADEKMDALAAEVQSRQEVIVDEAFGSQLQEISHELTGAVARYSEGRSVSVSADDLVLKPPKTTFSVSVGDMGIDTTVTRQGHGFQRTLLVAALQLLARRGAAANIGTICLAIEEPELFQHPPQARAFARVLRLLAEDQGQNVQVIYATHSPYFIEAGRFDQVRRLGRADTAEVGEAPEVSIRSITEQGLISRLCGYVNEQTVRNRADVFSLNRLPDALFARAVVLVEGPCDRAVIEGIAERDGQPPLLVGGIVIADVGGKDHLYLAHAILGAFGIPTYLFYDGDVRMAERMARRNKTPDAIRQCVANTASQNAKMSRFLGQEEVEWPETVVADHFAVIDDELETLLTEEWSEWANLLVAKSEEQGIDPEKNALIYREVSSDAAGRPPEFMTSLVKKIRSL